MPKHLLCHELIRNVHGFVYMRIKIHLNGANAVSTHYGPAC